MALDLSPEQAQYWGVIRSASSARISTSDLWAQIAAFEQAQGITRPAGLFAAVNQMRSLATSQRNAFQALQDASDEAAITSEMISQDFNSRPLTDQSTAPVWTIRFGVSILTENGVEDSWLTYRASGALPATKGDLVDLLSVEAPALGAGSNQVVVDTTGDVEISAY